MDGKKLVIRQPIKKNNTISGKGGGMLAVWIVLQVEACQLWLKYVDGTDWSLANIGIEILSI